jgi:ribosomal protein S18 acetylase RimI-like enzyme
MTSIVKATENDLQLLSDIAKTSFIESHGMSASPDDIKMYVDEKYNAGVFRTELSNPENIYRIIYNEKKPAGYSKLMFNVEHPDIEKKNVSKLERIYLLKKFYDLKLGSQLFNFNVELSKRNDQSGMWLFVWKENQRAVNFYTKAGFRIIGSHDFKLTETHSNPNHQMFLEY